MDHEAWLDVAWTMDEGLNFLVHVRASKRFLVIASAPDTEIRAMREQCICGRTPSKF